MRRKADSPLAKQGDAQGTDTAEMTRIRQCYEAALKEIREINQQLLIAGLREQELAAAAQESEQRARRAQQAVVLREQEAAVLAERTRIAEDFYDTLAQYFTGIKLQLDLAEDLLARQPQEAQEHLQRAREFAQESLREAHRCIRGLRSQELAHRDLPAALAALVEQVVDGPASVQLAVEGMPYMRDMTERKYREANLAFLAEIAEDFARFTTVADIMHGVGAKISAYLNLSHCLFAEIDEAQDTATIKYAWNNTGMPDVIGVFKLSEFITEEFRQAARRGETIVIRDTQTDPRTNAQAYAPFRIHSFVTVPFHHGGQWKHLFTVNAAMAREWRDDEIELIREVTSRTFLRLERARAEAALHESETHFRALADNIIQLAWIADATGWIFWYNRRWYEYTGTTLEEMQGWGWKSVHHPDHITPVTQRWQEHLRAGQEWEDTFPLLSKDGEWRWFLSRAFPLRDEAGNVTLWCGTNTDITEQRHTEQALRERQTEIEMLNARLTRAMQETHHRIKNNLQVIASLVEMQGYDTASDGETALRRINTHIRALATIHDLLTQQAKGDANLSELDAQAMLDRLIPMLQNMAQGRHIRYEADAVPLPVQQSAALALLVNELVSNATKHGTGDIEITLRLSEQYPPEQERRGARRARLEVCDDGPGFPEGFDPQKAANTGLELVDSTGRWDLKGEVSYENRKEGGARVVVTFPVTLEAT